MNRFMRSLYRGEISYATEGFEGRRMIEGLNSKSLLLRKPAADPVLYFPRHLAITDTRSPGR
ncbi:MAG TPA: hypothetical protein VG870_05795 [Chitinophagaceae bacterium]|nr:hypothetical protein [Chitinophagaceae bacterium]